MMAVLDLDVSAPCELQTDEAPQTALALLRVEGRPAGKALIPLSDLDVGSIEARLLEHADSAYWERWINHRLGLHREDALDCADVTIAVCTRDRPDDLKQCLNGLQRLHKGDQEILVIDNAPSNEATRDLVREMGGIRYVREERPGLDIARNRALREADTEIVAFIDDDAVPDRDWLRCLTRNFADPMVMASTGLTMPLELATDAQILFEQFGGFARGFRRQVYDATRLDPMFAWKAGAGVNMAMRRAVLDLVGPFDEALDAGSPTFAGGDTDMFRRILKSGYSIVYDPEALNWHRHRRSMAELRRQIFGYEVAAYAICTKAFIMEGDLGAFVHALRTMTAKAKSIIRLLLRHRNSRDLAFVALRLRGAMEGPFRYIYSRWTR